MNGRLVPYLNVLAVVFGIVAEILRAYVRSQGVNGSKD